MKQPSAQLPNATRRFRNGQRLLVDGGAGRVEAWGPAAGGEPTDEAMPGMLALLRREDEALESLHALEAHPRARESVYLNVQDPATGLVLVASAGVRPGGRGESLLAIGDGKTDVLFGLDRATAQADPDGFAVEGQRVTWHPFRFQARTRLSASRNRPLRVKPSNASMTIAAYMSRIRRLRCAWRTK